MSPPIFLVWFLDNGEFMIRKVAWLLAILAVIWGFRGSYEGLAWAESVPVPIETAGEEGKISFASFLKLAKEAPTSVYWIDTRDQSEVDVDGTISGAKVMNVRDLKKGMGGLPEDKPIVFFCSTGARAGEAYDLVQLKRPTLQVYFLDGSAEFRKQAIPVISPPK